MIRLITATPGSGKTCLVLEWLLREIDKGFYKTIYCNINDLKVCGVRPLLDDWRDVPPENTPALIIVDEAQYHDEFMKETTKDNQKGKDLSTHRHHGVDFWLITQSPKLLNSYVIENVGEHVHLYRPKKAKTVTVYWWSYAVTNLVKSNFKMADDVQKWRLNPHMFALYKSTVNVTDSKGRTSQKTVSTIITFLIIMAGIAWFVNQGMQSFNAMQHKNNETVLAVDKNQLPKADTKLTDDKTQSKADNNANSQSATQVAQTSQNTLETQNINDKPYIIGCMQLENKCNCYHEQGGIIDMPVHECKRYLQGYKPYQFRQSQQMRPSYETKTFTSNNPVSTTQADNPQVNQSSSNIIDGGNNAGFFDNEPTHLIGVVP